VVSHRNSGTLLHTQKKVPLTTRKRFETPSHCESYSVQPTALANQKNEEQIDRVLRAAVEPHCQRILNHQLPSILTDTA
jgi:hypothetical protein